MQSFSFQEPLPWSRQLVWTTLDTTEYAEARAAASRDSAVQIEPLSTDVDDSGRRHRHARHTLNRELPRMMQRFTGPKMRYLVHEVVDADAFRVDWTATPELARARRASTQRVHIRGFFAFEATGAASCERLVKVSVEVAIPGLGGRIEAGILKGLRQSSEQSAAFANAYLQERLP